MYQCCFPQILLLSRLTQNDLKGFVWWICYWIFHSDYYNMTGTKIPRLWNSLPTSDGNLISSFKNSLKLFSFTHLNRLKPLEITSKFFLSFIWSFNNKGLSLFLFYYSWILDCVLFYLYVFTWPHSILTSEKDLCQTTFHKGLRTIYCFCDMNGPCFERDSNYVQFMDELWCYNVFSILKYAI